MEALLATGAASEGWATNEDGATALHLVRAQLQQLQPAGGS